MNTEFKQWYDAFFDEAESHIFKTSHFQSPMSEEVPEMDELEERIAELSAEGHFVSINPMMHRAKACHENQEEINKILIDFDEQRDDWTMDFPYTYALDTAGKGRHYVIILSESISLFKWKDLSRKMSIKYGADTQAASAMFTRIPNGYRGFNQQLIVDFPGNIVNVQTIEKLCAGQRIREPGHVAWNTPGFSYRK